MRLLIGYLLLVPLALTFVAILGAEFGFELRFALGLLALFTAFLFALRLSGVAQQQ